MSYKIDNDWTPWERIIRGADRGTGLRLNAAEIQLLGMDSAIAQKAANDSAERVNCECVYHGRKPKGGEKLSYGKSEKPCIAYKHWPANPGLCGVCAWEKDGHNGAHVRSNLEPHQIRMVHELRDLEDRREKLQLFIDKPDSIFRKLPEDERQRMLDKSRYMFKYAEVLRARLSAVGL